VLNTSNEHREDHPDDRLEEVLVDALGDVELEPLFVGQLARVEPAAHVRIAELGHHLILRVGLVMHIPIVLFEVIFSVGLCSLVLNYDKPCKVALEC
jgi:hypothetical protein